MFSRELAEKITRSQFEEISNSPLIKNYESTRDVIENKVNKFINVITISLIFLLVVFGVIIVTVPINESNFIGYLITIVLLLGSASYSMSYLTNQQNADLDPLDKQLEDQSTNFVFWRYLKDRSIYNGDKVTTHGSKFRPEIDYLVIDVDHSSGEYKVQDTKPEQITIIKKEQISKVNGIKLWINYILKFQLI